MNERPSTIIQWLQFAKSELPAYLEERERQNIASELLQRILHKNRLELSIQGYSEVSEELAISLSKAIARLNLGEPLQYVTGISVFADLDLIVNHHVLIPRPETEELLHLVLNECKPNDHILDIGTGSGCIPCLLKFKKPDIKIQAWDLCEAALAVAAENARKYNLDIQFSQCDALAKWPETDCQFDIIVSNPPYIPMGDKSTIDAHVLDFEPQLALFAPENDVLAFYRVIAEQGRYYLVSNGKVFLELNADLAQDCHQLFEDYGYRNVQLHQDLQGKWRFLSAENIKF